ncbi:GH116 family glycosyl-hydrolase [Sulfolobus tengchongensis]|uniref:GH116 family glycosyl-hydrolase n=1 Tax=Sulfolobus tengchongensis TaxID=207809 RepID=A0AAX4L3Z5_9CREN
MKYKYSYALNSGVVLGGLGTGSIEIRADGRLYDWTIFNNGGFTERHDIRNTFYLNQFDFFVGVKSKGKSRILQAYDYYFGASPYTVPWLRPVREVEYVGEPPIAYLKFKDDFEVTLKAFSPFIPHDIKNSSLPVAIFEYYTYENSDFILGLKNPFENGKIEFKGDTLVFSGEVPSNDPRYNGNLCVRVENGSFAKLDNFPHFAEWNEFREKGKIVKNSGEKWGIATVNGNKVTFILSWYFPNHLDYYGKKIGHFYENYFSNCVEVSNYVKDNFNYLSTMTQKFHDILYNPKGVEDWIADLVGSQLTTLVKSTWLSKEGNFYIWEGYYNSSDERKDNNYSYSGGPLNGAFNTVDVTFYFMPVLVSLFPSLAKNLMERVEALDYGPLYVLYSLSIHENKTKFLEKVSKDPSILATFDRILETVKEVVKETGKDPKGRIGHFIFRGGKTDEFGRNDLNPQFTLMWALVSLYTSDEEFKQRLMNRAKEGMESVLRTHSYEGLIYSKLPSGFEFMRHVYDYFKSIGDSGFSNNLLLVNAILGQDMFRMSMSTYDDWSTVGITSFTSLLGIDALYILNKLANERYDVQKLLSTLKQYLWNGEYFDNWYDPISGFRDKANNASQLIGEFYLNLINDSLLTREEVKRILSSIMKYNFKEEEGVINGAYPDGYRPLMRSYENPIKIEASIQQDTPWSGVEFYLASHLLYEKMIDEAKKVLREIYDRYSIAGNFWNHWEWGSHYSRPLSSLLVIPAYLGLKFDGKRLILNPVTNLSWIIILPQFWGEINVEEKDVRINVIEGKIDLDEILIEGKKIKEIIADGRKIEGKIIAEKELLITLE